MAPGLSQILNESGAPKGSFYYYFPDGKEQLAEAAVKEAGAEITLIIEKAFRDGDRFNVGLNKLASSVGTWFAKSNFAAGCPITSVLLETVPESEKLRLVCLDVLSEWSATVARHAEAGGYSPREAARIGDATIMSLEGAWVLSRARRSTDPFQTIVEALSPLLQK